MCLTAPTTAEPLVRFAPAMTRELIGFEFETDLAITHEANREFIYQTVLFERLDKSGKPMWSIIVDGIVGAGRTAVLEFRTEPLGTVDALYTCIMDMAVFAFRVGERVEKAEHHVLSFADVVIALDGWEGLKPASAGVLLTGGKSVGAPQVTIGIALWNIAQALVSAQRFELTEFVYQEKSVDVPAHYRLFANQTLALPGLRSAAEFDGPTRAFKWACGIDGLEEGLVNTRALHQVFQNPQVVPIIAGYLAGHYEVPRSPEMLKNVRDAYSSAGLMALTLTYLNAGWYVSGTVKYSKAAFPVMVRNSFAALYRSLRKGTAFTVDAAIALFGLTPGQLKKSRVFQNGFTAELKPLGGVKKVENQLVDIGRLSDNKQVDFGPRIKDWLTSIIDASWGAKGEACPLYDQALGKLSPPAEVQGHDLLSRGSVRYSSTSLGAKRLVSVSSIPFAVIEFREWPKVSLEPKLWISLATRLFEFYYLHSGSCADFPSPWVSSPDLLWYYQNLKLKRSVWAGRGFHYTPGNCLFDTTAYQLASLHNIQYTPAALRAMAAKEIATRPGLYLDFLAGDLGDEDPFAVVENAAAYLAVDRNWEEDVADLAVAALANALRRDGVDVMLNVIGFDGKLIQSFGRGMVVVPLLYNGVDHYMPDLF